MKLAEKSIKRIQLVIRVRTLIWFTCLLCLFSSDAFGRLSERSLAKQGLTSVGDCYLPFIRNKGQLHDHSVRYYADTADCRLLVTGEGRLRYEARGGRQSESKRPITECIVNAGTIVVQGQAPKATKYHIFNGRDKKDWHHDIATYQTLSMGAVYDGIRMNLKYHRGNVEKLFYLDAGADPDQIRLAVDHVTDLAVNAKGELVLRTDLGGMRFSKPMAYQMIGKKRRMVAVDYRVQGNTYGFKLGPYDTARRLIIDPLINSYSIESKSEKSVISAMASDDQGNVYAAGSSNNDFVVYQFDPQISEITAFVQFGHYVCCQYSNNFVTGVALDSQNNVFVTGYTNVRNFPVTAGCLDDLYTDQYSEEGFIIKFDPDLTRIVAATFLGGDGMDRPNGIVIDTDDHIYVAGSTRHPVWDDDQRFPVSEDGFDTSPGEKSQRKGFIVKLDNDLTTLLASTFLGGSSQAYYGDAIGDIALDANGKVYVGGSATSADFPIRDGVDTEFNGNSEAFVARFDEDLTTLEASTFLGGMNLEEVDEQVKAIVVDRQNPPSVYAVGWTSSTDFSTPQGYDTGHNREEDGFIVKLNMDLNQIQSATFLGGHGQDEITCMALAPAVEEDNDILIVGGRTESDNFPTTEGCHDPSFGGNDKCFVGRSSYHTGDGFISFFDHDLMQLHGAQILSSPKNRNSNFWE